MALSENWLIRVHLRSSVVLLTSAVLFKTSRHSPAPPPKHNRSGQPQSHRASHVAYPVPAAKSSRQISARVLPRHPDPSEIPATPHPAPTALPAPAPQTMHGDRKHDPHAA